MTLLETAMLLDCEHNFAFSPRAGTTFCNCFVSVFCAARGVRLPPVSANDQSKYLIVAEAWQRVGRDEAVTLANAHELVVASMQALPHGHISPLVESPDDDPSGCYVSAAGAHNFNCARIERSFGTMLPLFFHYTGVPNV